MERPAAFSFNAARNFGACVRAMPIKPFMSADPRANNLPSRSVATNGSVFVATERDGKLFARGSADMKGFIGIALTQAPKFLAALNENRLDAPLHYAPELRRGGRLPRVCAD